MSDLEQLRSFEIPSLIAFDAGQGGLTRAVVTTAWSRAEIYLHGAQVTAFQKTGDAPLLFLSRASRFAPGKAIRGGVPICFPWFGPRAGDVAHGFARITEWQVASVAADPPGGVTLGLRLPETAGRAGQPAFSAAFAVTITDRLTLELTVQNPGAAVSECESCLHTYFKVGDVEQIALVGLRQALYLDKTNHDAERLDTDERLRIHQQTDRTYLNTVGPVEIHDPVLKRVIRIEKTGSASTVVWNPWTTQPLADLLPDEHRQMVCVESGNVERNRLALSPGGISVMKVVLSTKSSPVVL
ncbi:MAG: D-hexose-6-phosphate mutarotase [Verrucomicrobiota bacterium]